VRDENSVENVSDISEADEEELKIKKVELLRISR